MKENARTQEIPHTDTNPCMVAESVQSVSMNCVHHASNSWGAKRTAKQSYWFEPPAWGWEIRWHREIMQYWDEHTLPLAQSLRIQWKHNKDAVGGWQDMTRQSSGLLMAKPILLYTIGPWPVLCCVQVLSLSRWSASCFIDLPSAPTRLAWCIKRCRWVSMDARCSWILFAICIQLLLHHQREKMQR